MSGSSWQEGALTGSKKTGVQVWPCEMQRSLAPAARAAPTAATTSSTVLGTITFPGSTGGMLCSTFCTACKMLSYCSGPILPASCIYSMEAMPI